MTNYLITERENQKPVYCCKGCTLKGITIRNTTGKKNILRIFNLKYKNRLIKN